MATKIHGIPKIAVVTGSSGGIGSALCRLLAAKGIAVVLVDRNLQKSQTLAAALNLERAGSALASFSVDLASHSDIKRLAAEILAAYPRIDYLFNNAGVLTETLEFSGHGNELHFEVNTLAPLQLIDRLRPALKNAGAAAIVNTSAGISLQVKELNWDELVKPAKFSKLFGPYTKSKEALNVLTAALAPELNTDNIVIRASDPGPTNTALTKGAGTPLWMRAFYWLLPTPDKSAKKILDAAFPAGWGTKTGIFISNHKIGTLPTALADRAFQSDFLLKCRERADEQ